MGTRGETVPITPVDIIVEEVTEEDFTTAASDLASGHVSSHGSADGGVGAALRHREAAPVPESDLDYASVYEALFVYDKFGRRDEFKALYRDNRRRQAESVLMWAAIHAAGPSLSSYVVCVCVCVCVCVWLCEMVILRNDAHCGFSTRVTRLDVDGEVRREQQSVVSQRFLAFLHKVWFQIRGSLVKVMVLTRCIPFAGCRILCGGGYGAKDDNGPRLDRRG